MGDTTKGIILILIAGGIVYYIYKQKQNSANSTSGSASIGTGSYTPTTIESPFGVLTSQQNSDGSISYVSSRGIAYLVSQDYGLGVIYKGYSGAATGKIYNSKGTIETATSLFTEVAGDSAYDGYISDLQLDDAYQSSGLAPAGNIPN